MRDGAFRELVWRTILGDVPAQGVLSPTDQVHDVIHAEKVPFGLRGLGVRLGLVVVHLVAEERSAGGHFVLRAVCHFFRSPNSAEVRKFRTRSFSDELPPERDSSCKSSRVTPPPAPGAVGQVSRSTVASESDPSLRWTPRSLEGAERNSAGQLPAGEPPSDVSWSQSQRGKVVQ